MNKNNINSSYSAAFTAGALLYQEMNSVLHLLMQPNGEELMKDEHNSLWSAVIYGTYGSSGEITEWKKRGKEWSNIRLGTSSKQISNAGCLVTSIAILIKKIYAI